MGWSIWSHQMAIEPLAHRFSMPCTAFWPSDSERTHSNCSTGVLSRELALRASSERRAVYGVEVELASCCDCVDLAQGGEALERIDLDLTHAFACHSELLADLLEGVSLLTS